MLIKSADNKSKRLALLQDLQNSPNLDEWQKKRLSDELLKVRRGMQGEKDAAYYLDNHFSDGKNHAVIHDLRLDFDGEIAQIDHLLINRLLDFYLIETKSFSGDITVAHMVSFRLNMGLIEFTTFPHPSNKVNAMKTFCGGYSTNWKLKVAQVQPRDLNMSCWLTPRPLSTGPMLRLSTPRWLLEQISFVLGN